MPTEVNQKEIKKQEKQRKWREEKKKKDDEEEEEKKKQKHARQEINRLLLINFCFPSSKVALQLSILTFV